MSIPIISAQYSGNDWEYNDIAHHYQEPLSTLLWTHYSRNHNHLKRTSPLYHCRKVPRSHSSSTSRRISPQTSLHSPMYRDSQTHCSCNPHTNTHCIQCPHLRKLYLFYFQIHPIAIPTTVLFCDVFSQIQRRRHLVMTIWIAIRIPLRLDIHSIFWSISLVRIVIKIIPRPAGGWQTWTWHF